MFFAILYIDCSCLFEFCGFRKIKVWDLQAALDPRSPANSLCLRTLVASFVKFTVYCFLLRIFSILQEHTGRVFRLQFDEFQIISSSHDDSILIWDFLNVSPPEDTQ